MSHGEPMAQMAGHAGHPGTGGHDRHAGHSVAMFRDKFWLSLALTIPVVLLSRDIQGWFGYRVPAFPGAELLPAIIGTAIFAYGGLVFLRGAQGELGRGVAAFRPLHTRARGGVAVI